MKSRMKIPDVTLLVSQTLPDSRAVPGQGVVIGQGVVDAFFAAQDEHPDNPDIFSAGLGWVMSHEYSHFFQIRYRMGLEAPYDGFVKRYVGKPEYWEAMADVLASYYVGARATELLNDERKRRPMAATVVEATKACARKAVLDFAAKHALSNLANPAVQLTASWRQDAIEEGLKKGFDQAFGLDFAVFQEKATTEQAKKAQQWLIQATEAALTD